MQNLIGVRGLKNLVNLAVILFSIYSAIYFFIFKEFDFKVSSFQTIPIIDKSKISPGYTLITPYNRFTQIGPGWEGKVYLLDLFGKSVHTWKTRHQALYSVLKPNGNLLVTMELPKYEQKIPGGGNTGIIQELDWDSNVVWEYKNELLHHDIVPLKNGNVVTALWEKTPKEIIERVRGGVPNTEIEGEIYSDLIVEINSKGEIVWEWHSYEHMNPEIDVISEMIPRQGWTYVNGISFMEKNPIDQTEGYLVSMRSVSTVYIIRKSDGEILWRSPKGILNVQHDPALMQNGNILVFDNGLYRIPNPFPVFGSRAVEINPKTNEVVWQFDAGEGTIDKVKLFSPIVGGVQELSNGNILITDGVKGHIFEVTKEKEVVWDIISPYTTIKTGHFPNNFLFKARRYRENEINWPEKTAPALDEFKYNLYQNLNRIYPN